MQEFEMPTEESAKQTYYIDSGNGYVYCFSDEPFEGAKATDKEIIRCSDGKYRLSDQTTETGKEYEELVKKEHTKQEAQSYLNSTDWYIARYIDTGKEIPEDVKLKRSKCRELL